MTRDEAIAYRQTIENAAALQTDAAALENIYLYPSWKEKLSLKVGERYRYNGVLYKCIQAHTTQEDWTPDVSPALFTKVSLDEWPEWVQPTGAQDAYMLGDKVSHGGKHWESDVDNNVWEPGAAGTEALWHEV